MGQCAHCCGRDRAVPPLDATMGKTWRLEKPVLTPGWLDPVVFEFPLHAQLDKKLLCTRRNPEMIGTSREDPASGKAGFLQSPGPQRLGSEQRKGPSLLRAVVALPLMDALQNMVGHNIGQSWRCGFAIWSNAV